MIAIKTTILKITQAVFRRHPVQKTACGCKNPDLGILFLS